LRHCNNIKAGVYVATALRPADDQEFVFPQQPAEFHWAQFEKILTSAVVNTFGARCALAQGPLQGLRRRRRGVDNKPFELMRLLPWPLCARVALFSPCGRLVNFADF
jgi:hypothetical protein